MAKTKAKPTKNHPNLLEALKKPRETVKVTGHATYTIQPSRGWTVQEILDSVNAGEARLKSGKGIRGKAIVRGRTVIAFVHDESIYGQWKIAE